MAGKSGTDAGDQGEGGDAGGEGGGFQAITTQEEFDKVFAKALGPKLQRERDKFKDYQDLKAKADKFDEAEARTKTLEEQNADRLSKMENDLQTERLSNLRLRIASKHGLPDGYSEFLTGTTEEILDEQAVKLLELGKEKLVKGGHVAGEGSTPPPTSEDPKKAFLASLRDPD